MLIIIPLRLPQRRRCIHRNRHRGTIPRRRHRPTWPRGRCPSCRCTSNRIRTRIRFGFWIFSRAQTDKTVVRPIDIIPLAENVRNVVYACASAFSPDGDVFDGDVCCGDVVRGEEVESGTFSAVLDGAGEVAEGDVG